MVVGRSVFLSFSFVLHGFAVVGVSLFTRLSLAARTREFCAFFEREVEARMCSTKVWKLVACSPLRRSVLASSPALPDCLQIVQVRVAFSSSDHSPPALYNTVAHQRGHCTQHQQSSSGTLIIHHHVFVSSTAKLDPPLLRHAYSSYFSSIPIAYMLYSNRRSEDTAARRHMVMTKAGDQPKRTAGITSSADQSVAHVSSIQKSEDRNNHQTHERKKRFRSQTSRLFLSGPGRTVASVIVTHLQ